MQDVGMNGDLIQLSLPATHKYLNVVGACVTAIMERVEGLAEPQAATYNIVLAVHEICTNTVSHAYAGQSDGRIALSLALASAPRRLTIEVRDAGRSFDPASVPLPNLEQSQEHGYGLFLVHALMDEVTYSSDASGNCWRLTKTF